MGKQYMKTLEKVSIKVQRIIGTLSRMSIENANIIFSRISSFSVMPEMSSSGVFLGKILTER